MSLRRGFTLIELLVVVAIIAALAAMSLAGLSVLRRQSKIASTLDRMTHVTTAVDAYLQEYGRLGSAPDSSDFLQDPWYFLHKAQRKSGGTPLLDINLERLVERVGAGAVKRPEAVQTATHMLDFFGATSNNVLSFTIFNHNLGTNARTSYPNCIILRSSAGTVGNPKDDLFYARSADKASWRKLKYDDVDDFLAELDPVPTYDMKWVDPVN
jgi:prepilin-type N-terminal cleavage/methylation domain-containing protein